MSSLRIKTFSGVKWTSLTSISIAVMYLAQIGILSRLLTKEAFGLISITMVILGLAQAFVDMGFSNAIIYKQDATKKQLASLYWINIFSGITLSIILILSSPIIANFYNEPELKKIVILTALNFCVQPFGIQNKVLLQKELEFNLIAKIEIFSSFLGLLVAILWAMYSPSVYALVFSFLTTSIISSALFLMKGSNGRIPKFRVDFYEIRGFLSFGMYQMGERIINYLNSQFDVLLIGKVLGVEVVGVYAMSKQLVLRPTQVINPIITRVSFPLMSKLQNDNERLQKIYNKTINYLSSINFLIFGGLFVLAPEVVLIVFGSKWVSAIPVVRILSVFAAIRSTANPVGSLLLAKGRARLGFFWNLGLLLIIPIFMYMGSSFGVEGVCYSLCILMGLLVIPNWYFQVRALNGVSFFSYHKQIALPALIAVFSSFIAYVISFQLENMVFRIISVSSIGLILGSILHYLFNRSFIKDIFALVKNKL